MTNEELTARMAAVGEQLNAARKAKKMSYRDYEEATGINHSNLNRIERGILVPRLDTLLKMIDATGAKITL